MHFFTPQQTSILTAAAAGSFIALLLTRKIGWLHVLTLFAVGELTAFYWTVPIALKFGLTDWLSNVAFSLGALGMLIWGAILKVFERVHDDPTGTISWAYGLWKGRGNDGKRDDVP